jgi:hypothetical protein
MAFTATSVIAAAGLIAPMYGTATDAAPTAPTRDWVDTLVGSAHQAVFALTHYPPGSDPSLPPPGVPYTIVARAEDGATQSFPIDPGVDITYWFRWTLARSVVAAADRYAPSQVHWWNLADHTTGVLGIPPRSYVAADPAGVLYLTKSGVLKQKTLAGTVTVLGHPFKSRPDGLDGFSNARGVVISGFRVARYLTYAHPRRVRHLDIAAIRRPGKKASNYVGCDALSRTHTACTTFRTGRATRGAVIALDGGAPARARDPKENFPTVGLIGGRTLAWTRFAGKDAHSVVATVTAGSGKRAKGHHRVAFGHIITAYHKILVTPEAHRRILAATSAHKYQTIYVAPFAPTP